MQVISIHVTTNGPHGPAFALGAFRLSESGLQKSFFRAQCPLEGPPHPSIQQDVLPALADSFETHESAKEMRQDFWTWFEENREGADVFVDRGWPSATRFLTAVADDDPESRHAKGPFPLHEVATLLLAAGVDPQVDRQKYAEDMLDGQTGTRHDPLWEAYLSGLCVLKALKAVGRG